MPNVRVVKSNKRKRSQFFDDEAKVENVIRDSKEENEEEEHEEEREDFYETDAVPVEGNSASFYRRIDNGEATSADCSASKQLPKDHKLVKITQLQAEASKERAKLEAGDVAQGGFRCPICTQLLSRSTKESGKTSFWCPTKCRLPWKQDSEKPSFYATIAQSIASCFVVPNGKPPQCLHDETMPLLHLPPDKVKNEHLKNSFFFE